MSEWNSLSSSVTRRPCVSLHSELSLRKTQPWGYVSIIQSIAQHGEETIHKRQSFGTALLCLRAPGEGAASVF